MKKVLGVLLVLLLVAGGGLFYLYSQATSTDIGEELIKKSEMKEEQVEAIFDTLKGLETSEEPVVIKSEEINAITNKIAEDMGGMGPADIQSINTKVEDGKLHVQIPTKVKDRDIILSAKADLKCEEGNLVVKLDGLKSGKLELPSNQVGDKLGELINSDKVVIDGNEIKIDLEKLPYDIKDIKIDGNNILINGKKVN